MTPNEALPRHLIEDLKPRLGFRLPCSPELDGTGGGNSRENGEFNVHSVLIFNRVKGLADNLAKCRQIGLVSQLRSADLIAPNCPYGNVVFLISGEHALVSNFCRDSQL